MRLTKDLWSGILFMAAGVAFGIGSLSYRLGTSARPGPGYFPLGLSVLMALLGMIVFVGALRKPAEDEPIGPIAWRPLSIVVLAIVVFGWTLPHLGMAIALPLLVVIVSAAAEGFRWVGVLASAVVLTVASWAIFIKGLGLTLPMWPPFLG